MGRAEELFALLNSENLIGQKGQITLSLGGIDVKVTDVSVVGNILQEWLANFMKLKNFHFELKPNTQDFPDFLLSLRGCQKTDLLEVKAFTKSPNFDVANFKAYARSLRDKAYRLDAKYLIFKYSPIDEGAAYKIDAIWLKNVWEICGPAKRSDVKIQWKQGEPVNIRPVTFYSDRAEFQSFRSRFEFVEALNRVIGMAGVDASIQRNWLQTVKQNYLQHTQSQL